MQTVSGDFPEQILSILHHKYTAAFLTLCSLGAVFGDWIAFVAHTKPNGWEPPVLYLSSALFCIFSLETFIEIFMNNNFVSNSTRALYVVTSASFILEFIGLMVDFKVAPYVNVPSRARHTTKLDTRLCDALVVFLVMCRISQLFVRIFIALDYRPSEQGETFHGYVPPSEEDIHLRPSQSIPTISVEGYGHQDGTTFELEPLDVLAYENAEPQNTRPHNNLQPMREEDSETLSIHEKPDHMYRDFGSFASKIGLALALILALLRLSTYEHVDQSPYIYLDTLFSKGRNSSDYVTYRQRVPTCVKIYRKTEVIWDDPHNSNKNPKDLTVTQYILAQADLAVIIDRSAELKDRVRYFLGDICLWIVIYTFILSVSWNYLKKKLEEQKSNYDDYLLDVNPVPLYDERSWIETGADELLTQTATPRHRTQQSTWALNGLGLNIVNPLDDVRKILEEILEQRQFNAQEELQLRSVLRILQSKHHLDTPDADKLIHDSNIGEEAKRWLLSNATTPQVEDIIETSVISKQHKVEDFLSAAAAQTTRHSESEGTPDTVREIDDTTPFIRESDEEKDVENLTISVDIADFGRVTPPERVLSRRRLQGSSRESRHVSPATNDQYFMKMFPGHADNSWYDQLQNISDEVDVITRDIMNLSLDADTLLLDRETGSPLVHTSLCLIRKFDLYESLDLDMPRAYAFLRAIEVGYHDNPYHNRIHAAEVTIFSMHLLDVLHPQLLQLLSPTQKFAALISAAIHDVDHPGNNNLFEVNTSSRYATLYSDQSVLEFHHLAFAFTELKKPQNNFTLEWDINDFRAFRKQVVQTVLATDLGNHFQILNDIKKYKTVQRTDLPLIFKSMVKMSDLGHAAKGLDKHLYWTQRITEEFHTQGDVERNMGMDVSPLCDRNNSKLASGQVGFFKGLVLPLFKESRRFFEKEGNFKRVGDRIRGNFEYWENEALKDAPLSSPTKSRPEFSRQSETAPAVVVLDVDDDDIGISLRPESTRSAATHTPSRTVRRARSSSTSSTLDPSTLTVSSGKSSRGQRSVSPRMDTLRPSPRMSATPSMRRFDEVRSRPAKSLVRGTPRARKRNYAPERTTSAPTSYVIHSISPNSDEEDSTA